MVEEGAVPVTPYRPCAQEAMMIQYLFRRYRFLGEHKAAEVKPLLSVQVFLNLPPEPFVIIHRTRQGKNSPE